MKPKGLLPCAWQPTTCRYLETNHSNPHHPLHYYPSIYVQVFQVVQEAPLHHSMVDPQVVDGGHSFQMWKVAKNISNKQSQTAGG